MYTQITIKNAYFFSLLYIRMNGKNINFEKKKKKKMKKQLLQQKQIKTIFNMYDIDVN